MFSMVLMSLLELILRSNLHCDIQKVGTFKGPLYPENRVFMNGLVVCLESGFVMVHAWQVMTFTMCNPARSSSRDLTNTATLFLDFWSCEQNHTSL